MRILHIIAQKPNSTGSGIYMSGVISGLKMLGHDQSVIAGIDVNDSLDCSLEGISFYPVIYNTDKLDFNVLGMSDSMPYESTRYRDLDGDMIKKFKEAFKEKIELVIKKFNPDVVICHHLYLLTSFVRELLEDKKVVAVCHGTCLRQLKTINLERDYIKSNIRNLDLIFALHDEQKKEIIREFKIEEDKVVVIGSGYNDKIFTNKKYTLDNNKVDITFAGKICLSKGLESLIRVLARLKYPKESIRLNLAGTGSDKPSFDKIKRLGKECPFEVNFLGRINQVDLAEVFNKSHIFILPSFYEGLPVVILEALACGTDVITTDINGVRQWMGDEINNSGKIEYIKLPNMKSEGVPVEEELPRFENDLYDMLNKKVDSILNGSYYDKEVDMSDKTWDGLSFRISNYINRNFI